MLLAIFRHHSSSLAAQLRYRATTCGVALALAFVYSADAQQPVQPTPPETPQQTATPAAQAGDGQQPAATPEQTPAAPSPVVAPPATPATPAVPTTAETSKPKEAEESSVISEEALKQMLVGKALYLRGGYLDNSLKFDEHGHLIGHSPEGSYTLCAIEVSKVRLTKHKVELEGIRYALHFGGQLAYEDTSKPFDRVRITPKKKIVSITVDREIVVKPRKKKEPKSGKEKDKKDEAAPAVPPAAAPSELSEADQLKASIAAAPESERPADPQSVTTTTSQVHADNLLKEALGNVFAQGLDERMLAAMPEFWKLYYEAAAAKSDYRPKDPAVLRQNTVDKKALLLTKFEPDSNEFAQANGVAGMALFHTVVGIDGKAQEIVVGRPIGFGLDENAVSAIRKASFEPAIKDGKPVPVLLDLVVQFRIFSKRTSVHSEAEPADKPAEPVLPGPYSLPRP
jgi:outer membrane biosynthesis protein TonB